jgi:pyruvate/2-oxoglutarate/acetoin dehydrogenase E1 component
MSFVEMTYAESINKTLHALMENDPTIILVGQGVWSPWYVGDTCQGLLDKFGKERVIDTPVSECGVASMVCGLAIAGMRPILVFPRMDFMLYAADPIINQMAKWHYMTGGRVKVPCVIWAIINRFGCQGAQHSQDLAWLFRRVAGLKVVEPNGPRTAHELLVSAVYDNNPVVFLDDREKYGKKSTVDFSLKLNEVSLVDQLNLNMADPEMPVPAGITMEKEYKELYEHLQSAIY